MKIEFIAVDGTENGINFDAHYKIGRVGVAWYLLGWAVRYEPIMCLAATNENGGLEDDGTQDIEFEREADTDNVVAVMVGDDRREVVSVDDIKLLAEADFCRDCGQVGCHCNVYT